MKSGFFFTLLTAIALSFMVISLALWSATVAERELKVPAKFQVEALATIADAASQPQMQSLVSILGYRALYALDEDVRKTGVFVTRTNTSRELCSVLLNGTRLDGRRIFNESLWEWSDEMKNASARMGFDWNFSIGGCSASQDSAWSVLITLSDVKVKVGSQDMNITRSGVPVSTSFSILGLEDPLITVMDSRARGVPLTAAHVKQIFQAPYSINDAKPVQIAAGVRGKGWVYGNTTTSLGEAYKNDRFIFVTDSLEGVCHEGDCTQLNAYGGVILLGTAPSTEPAGSETRTLTGAGCTNVCSYQLLEETGDCLDCKTYGTLLEESNDNCSARCDLELTGTVTSNQIAVPFIIVPGKSFSDLGFAPGSDLGNPVLIDSPLWTSSSTGVKLWDIEKLRDLVTCGYYVAIQTAPSFFDRMEGNTNAVSNNGIESFVLGKWAKQDFSKVDHAYYTNMTAFGNGVKGMPGCRNAAMCVSESPVGRFMLDGGHASTYGASSLVCIGTMCGPPS